MSTEFPIAVPSPPTGWREKPLISVAEPRFSSVDKLTHSSETPVRLCNYIDVYNHEYITEDLEFMRASAIQPEIDRFGLKVGDVLITKDSETPDDIGVPAVADYAAPDLVCGYHLALIRPDQEQVDPTFLAKQLKHFRLIRYFGQQSNGLTRYGLPIGSVNKAPLWLPELLDEQKAIGKVLRLVDDAIAKTEAVISKMRQVRAGLLHDLLTRGLDHNGQLRDPIAHPEQFKGSPFGQIPREWQVRTVKQLELVIIDGDRGSNYPNESQLFDHGFCLFLNNKNISNGRIHFASAQFITEERDALLGKGKLTLGDIVITTRGTVGNIALFNDLNPHPHVRINSGMILLRAYQTLFIPEFFVALWSFLFPSEYHRLSSGSAQPQFPIRDIQGFRLLLFDKSEQERIVSALHRIEHQIGAEESPLAKLRKLKSGLMTDLLTGRVRMPDNFLTKAVNA